MGLRLKFNLMLVGAFVLGLALAGGTIWWISVGHAREEALDMARLMMAKALSVREYTDREIGPLLVEQMRTTFIPNSVPSYAAQTTFGAVRQNYPDFRYKEAALNPTNPADRATDWEADIINGFRGDPQRTELVLEREAAAGRELVLARPLVVRSERCLTCHSRPEVAPAPMLAVYGSANGFGWRLNETIGAQVVSVPLSGPFQRAMRETYVFVGALAVIFTIMLGLLNLLLGTSVLRPLKRLSQVAEQASLGDLDSPSYEHPARDEVGTLSKAFERLRRSLQSALRMLETR
jgi:HAMP domain-containing protein